jgi:hypothetical protein
MSVQILTYDKKVVTVNTGSETKVLAAGTIPTNASDYVEDLYANIPASWLKAMYAKFPNANTNTEWVTGSYTWTGGNNVNDYTWITDLELRPGLSLWIYKTETTGGITMTYDLQVMISGVYSTDNGGTYYADAHYWDPINDIWQSVSNGWSIDFKYRSWAV